MKVDVDLDVNLNVNATMDVHLVRRPPRASTMRSARSTSALLALALALASCAPVVDGPAEHARAADLADSDRVSAQLAALPEAWSAHAIVHHAFRDPLTGAGSPALASALVVVEAGADRASVQHAAEALVHAAAPDVAAPVVLVVAGAPRPELADVGPFRVDRRSRGALIAALAGGLAIIAALAIALARASRRRDA